MQLQLLNLLYIVNVWYNILVKVYYCDICYLNILDLNYEEFCKDRKSYVDSIKDDKRKAQSVLVWKLLTHVTAGEIIEFGVTDEGEWYDKNGKVYFSLSHSNNIVAVAISNLPVGVDVEKCCDKITKIKRRFDYVHDDSLTLTENLTKQWTIEESAFKAKNYKNVFSEKIKDLLNNEYYISVCGEDEKIEIIPVSTEDFIK